MTYFLMWLFFGIFTALLASSRNRNVLGWFFIGFLFGPFGLLFAFFMKNDNDLKEEKNTKNEALKSTNDKILSEDTYHYLIRPKKGVKTEDEWHRVKKCFLNFLDTNYRIKQNDGETIFIEVSKSAYVKMTKIKKNDERGSLELLFKVDSVKCGNIDFENDMEIVLFEKEETVSAPLAMDKTEKLIKLSEMLEKGLITKEEFTSQKEQLLQ